MKIKYYPYPYKILNSMISPKLHSRPENLIFYLVIIIFIRFLYWNLEGLSHYN